MRTTLADWTRRTTYNRIRPESTVQRFDIALWRTHGNKRSVSLVLISRDDVALEDVMTLAGMLWERNPIYSDWLKEYSAKCMSTEVDVELLLAIGQDDADVWREVYGQTTTKQCPWIPAAYVIVQAKSILNEIRSRGLENRVGWNGRAPAPF